MPEPPVTWTVAALAVMSGAAAIPSDSRRRGGTWPGNFPRRHGIPLLGRLALCLPAGSQSPTQPAPDRPIHSCGSLYIYAFPVYLVHIPFVIGFGTREVLGKGEDWTVLAPPLRARPSACSVQPPPS